MNLVTASKYLDFFQTDKINQYSNKKKLIEMISSKIGKVIDINLSSKNMATALNKIVDFLPKTTRLAYLAGPKLS